MSKLSPAAAAITPAQIRQSYRARVTLARRGGAPRIPGVARPGSPRSSNGLEDRQAAERELAELMALPPGTERTRAYVRIYDRINRLVHATPEFVPAPDL